MIFLVTIICVVGVNIFLVLVKSLLVPYVNPIKYDYQILPAFCWIVASLVDKCCSLLNWKNFKNKQHILIFSIAIIGLFALIASMVVNMKILNMFTRQDYLLFMVEGEIGYPFQKLSPISRDNFWEIVQGLGFVSIALSLFWFNLDELKLLVDWIKARL